MTEANPFQNCAIARYTPRPRKKQSCICQNFGKFPPNLVAKTICYETLRRKRTHALPFYAQPVVLLLNKISATNT